MYVEEIKESSDLYSKALAISRTFSNAEEAEQCDKDAFFSYAKGIAEAAFVVTSSQYLDKADKSDLDNKIRTWVFKEC